jgi:hypothetical protein
VNDYSDSAERHYLSAGILSDQHPATASHCFGIAAECVLKALMCNLQPQAQKVSGKHLGQSLWTEFANHQTVQAHPSRVAWAQKHQTGFDGWDVNQRYWSRANAQFGTSQLSMQQRSAQGLMGMLQLIQRGLA